MYDEVGDHETVRQFLIHIQDLAEENQKGMDGYEMINEWATKALKVMGEYT